MDKYFRWDDDEVKQNRVKMDYPFHPLSIRNSFTGFCLAVRKVFGPIVISPNTSNIPVSSKTVLLVIRNYF